jgi:hypothetical protein
MALCNRACPNQLKWSDLPEPFGPVNQNRGSISPSSGAVLPADSEVAEQE